MAVDFKDRLQTAFEREFAAHHSFPPCDVFQDWPPCSRGCCGSQATEAIVIRHRCRTKFVYETTDGSTGRTPRQGRQACAGRGLAKMHSPPWSSQCGAQKRAGATEAGAHRISESVAE